jgi:hypothetical protein
MARRTVTFLLMLVLGLIAPVLGMSPARAAPTEAEFYAVITSSEPSGECTHGFGGSSICHYVETGNAVRFDGTLFKLTINKRVFVPRACWMPELTGTWSLTHGADSLTGTMPQQNEYPSGRRMPVTSGSGLYAGLTDANPHGDVQDFGDTTTPGVEPFDTLSGLIGCGSGYTNLGLPHGGLKFRLVPA